MQLSAEKEERHKERMLPQVGFVVMGEEQSQPSHYDHLWSPLERGNLEAEAFVLWYQVNQ